MIENLQSMQTGMLLENFRALCRQIGMATGREQETLSKKADRYEEEILRRVAW